MESNIDRGMSMKGQVMADFVVESPQQPARDRESERQSGGPYKSTEPLGCQDPEWNCCYNLQLEEYGARDEHVMQFLIKIRDTLQRLSEWTIEKVPRADTSYLGCLDHSETQYVLAKLHKGICGNHSGGRSLARCVHSQGYYWPTMKKDATTYVKKCDKCQSGTPVRRSCLEEIHARCMNYFSNWVEVEVYASIKDKDVTKFVGRTSFSALKKRLEQAKGKWVEALPGHSCHDACHGHCIVPASEPRHVTCATARAMMHATGPCLVPTIRAKTRDAFHRPCHDACHGALLSAHEPSQDM
ncbi:hypothetical protein CK203_024655 [Vitis vinifera]|uniref:Integrase zinc-binding domain-containing protein n=1 Tax=Vitis vinifera TaxID=29760 RepID=A0A438IUC9_VITVI|nr:hypothetical protein CK203_024655 [Vitis vinifera]